MRPIHAAIVSAGLLVLSPTGAWAECSNQLPPWLAQDLTGRLLQDKTQTYFVGRASAATEQEARALARKDAEAQIASCNFLTIGSKTSVKKERNRPVSSISPLDRSRCSGVRSRSACFVAAG